MKNFCKFLCGAISLFVLSCSENIDTIGNSKVNGVVPKDEKVSMEIYGNLDDSFISGTRTGEGFIYPDYYGGSYIDDNGGLIILTTDSVESVVKDLRFRTKSSNFSIKNCEYSLNELQSLNEELGKVFENQNIASELKWVSVGIDIVHNKVSVDLEDCSESIIVKFKSMVSNSSMIKFNEVAPIIFDSGYVSGALWAAVINPWSLPTMTRNPTDPFNMASIISPLLFVAFPILLICEPAWTFVFEVAFSFAVILSVDSCISVS